MSTTNQTTTHLIVSYLETHKVNSVIFNTEEYTQDEAIELFKKLNDQKFNFSFLNVEGVKDGSLYIWN